MYPEQIVHFHPTGFLPKNRKWIIIRNEDKKEHLPDRATEVGTFAVTDPGAGDVALALAVAEAAVCP